jgi:hypothetical protein
VDRREFLRVGIVGASGAVALPCLATVAGAQSSVGPYGSIDDVEPDDNGVILPPGFTSRIVAIAGESVGDTGYEWHAFPDGAGTFEDGRSGWYHVCNSEVHVAGAGGVSAIHFAPDGEILEAYRILEGSISNCAGGPTPWGTWLSCEEEAGGHGLVWECDPAGKDPSVAHPAMGLFKHEAVAVDPVAEQLYLTQDEPLGNLYRYTPQAYPDLSAGLLEAATVDPATASVMWTEVPDPSGQSARTKPKSMEPRSSPEAKASGITLTSCTSLQRGTIESTRSTCGPRCTSGCMNPAMRSPPMVGPYCQGWTTSRSTLELATSTWPRTVATWKWC